MFKKQQTALVASLIFALAVSASGPAFATSANPFMPDPSSPAGGAATIQGVATNESISNEDLMLGTAPSTLPCDGGAAMAQGAVAATNGLIATVNREAGKVGSEMRAKRMCLENINALISLSIPSFPSLSAIIGKIVAGIINAMINKACAAVVGAINGAVNAVNSAIQGAKDEVMRPLNDMRGQLASQAPSSGGQTQWVTPAAVTPTLPSVSGTGVASFSSARNVAPPAAIPAPTPAPAPTGWKGISCKIFGGC